ncbi:MAG: hypothetical protein JWQ75_677, partial [Pseudarthrobacter sp.]|nr:hypothetical protein [Pseudarthrobacter sp.]
MSRGQVLPAAGEDACEVTPRCYRPTQGLTNVN